MVYTFNPSTVKAETGGSLLPSLHNKPEASQSYILRPHCKTTIRNKTNKKSTSLHNTSHQSQDTASTEMLVGQEVHLVYVIF